MFHFVGMSLAEKFDSDAGQAWMNTLETVIYENSPIKEHIETALNYVRGFIKKEKRVLYGGMAIDLAMRSKGKKLYDDNAVPDYDFYSPNHYVDAYAIARHLHTKGLPNLQVIVAAHQTTLRVRVDFETVADVSYMPPEVYKVVEKMALKSDDGLKFVHPHFQMIDQHRSLAFPLRDFPMSPVYNRWTKDMKRFNMLYEEFPLGDLGEFASGESKKNSLEVPLLEKKKWKPSKKYCLLGYGALCYWMNLARKKGYSGPGVELEYGDKDDSFLVPNGEMRYVAYATYSGNIKPTHHGLIEWIPPRFLEKNEEIWLTAGTTFTAKDAGGFWVASLQHCLMYFMYLYMFHGHSTWAYLITFELVKWGCKNRLMDFAPNASAVFGEDDVSEIYEWHRENFRKKIKTRVTPDNIYFEDKPRDIPYDPPEFKYEAEMFNQTGEKIATGN